MSLDILPAELVKEVVDLLSPNDLAQLALVSKKYSEFAQAKIWENIELHRQDAHKVHYGLTDEHHIPRAYLDDCLREPRSYRNPAGNDIPFKKRSSLFYAVVRNAFRTAGKSDAWNKLGSLVQQLCLTVSHRSPKNVWDMVLSLLRLRHIEIIGEWALTSPGPPKAATLREPSATKIKSVRLRGYIPQIFVATLCRCLAPSITRLNLGILESPKRYPEIPTGSSDYLCFETLASATAPRGVQWYDADAQLPFSSLTHLHLCRSGSMLNITLERNILEEAKHEMMDLKQWASMIQSVRSTLEKLVLEQRPFKAACFWQDRQGPSAHERICAFPDPSNFDSSFYHVILKGVFGNKFEWPKLRKLTLSGISLVGIEEKENGKDLNTFMSGIYLKCILSRLRGTTCSTVSRGG